MNDALIRKRFHEQVLTPYRTSPNTMVIDELGLQHGSCRADIAIVNGRMIGFEIKGETDSLKRLREQVAAENLTLKSPLASLKELGPVQLKVLAEAVQREVRTQRQRAAVPGATDPISG